MLLSLRMSRRRQISGLMPRRTTRSWYTTASAAMFVSGMPPSCASPSLHCLPRFVPLSNMRYSARFQALAAVLSSMNTMTGSDARSSNSISANKQTPPLDQPVIVRRGARAYLNDWHCVTTEASSNC